MAVRVTRDGRGIYSATLDNPARRNALSAAMFETLIGTLATASEDQDARGIVIRGAPGMFCSGRDVGDIAGGSVDVAVALAPILRLQRAMQDCAVPIIAMVEGKAAGLGVSLVCWSDIAIATIDSSFSIPEARAGITPSITAVSLIEAVGRRYATELCLTGRSIDAGVAASMGLVHYQCQPDAGQATLESVIESIRKGGPRALRLAKALFHNTRDNASQHWLDAATATAEQSFKNTEVSEGIGAFRDKRSPPWLVDA